MHDPARKLPVYAGAGVAWAWLVDPGERLVEVFRLRDGQWVLESVAGGDEEVGLPPFEGVPLALGRLGGDSPRASTGRWDGGAGRPSELQPDVDLG